MNTKPSLVSLCEHRCCSQSFREYYLSRKHDHRFKYEKKPCDISSFSQGLEQTRVHTAMETIQEIHIDQENKIVSAPCYMMDASILEIHKNIHDAISATIKLIV